MSMCRCGSSGSARRTSTRCPLRRPRWGAGPHRGRQRRAASARRAPGAGPAVPRPRRRPGGTGRAGRAGCWTWNGPATPNCSAPASANRSTPAATWCSPRPRRPPTSGSSPGSTGCGPSPTQWTASPTDRGERLAPSTGRDHCCRLPRRRASRSDRGRCASRLTAASPPGPEDSALVEFAAAWWLIVDRPQTGGAVWGSVAVAVRAGVVGSEGS